MTISCVISPVTLNLLYIRNIVVSKFLNNVRSPCIYLKYHSQSPCESTLCEEVYWKIIFVLASRFGNDLHYSRYFVKIIYVSNMWKILLERSMSMILEQYFLISLWLLFNVVFCIWNVIYHLFGLTKVLCPR